VCLKSGILCQGCESRLKEGKISKLDAKISRILFELAQKHRGLEKINFKRAIDAGNLIVLVVGWGEIRFAVGRSGKVIRELEGRLQTKIRVVEGDTEARKLAQDILTPAKVLGVNVLYTEGKEKHRVRVPRSHLKRLPASTEDIQAALTKLTNKNIKIDFE
jgi:transcription antitermination factor NusA-like protein